MIRDLVSEIKCTKITPDRFVEGSDKFKSKSTYFKQIVLSSGLYIAIFFGFCYHAVTSSAYPLIASLSNSSLKPTAFIDLNCI